MGTYASPVTTVPIRREPPHFRPVTVDRVEARSPRMVRVTLTGTELAGFDIGLPAASVRLLLPPSGHDEVVLPTWNGNEFLYDDGARPAIRTLTPLRFDADTNALDVEIVLHGEGPLSSWAARAAVGDRAAVAGTGRGYTVDPHARSFLLAGDESALPAMGLLLAALPVEAAVRVLIEIGDPSARLDLPVHPNAQVQWLVLDEGAVAGDALVAAVVATPLDPDVWPDVWPDVHIWAAGEAAAMQRIRRHLFETGALPRSRAVVRGYWKHGRGGDPADD